MGAGRAAGCTVLHVDMDAFFASVEVAAPELAGTPVIVGGAGNRGVVTSATYEARRYGVHSAMPTARALRLCPTATVLPGDMALYAEVSRSIMALFRSITPLVEPLTLDEAFLDVSGSGRRLGRRRADRPSTSAPGSSTSRGSPARSASPTKFVAKLASTRAKPDGLLVVRPPEVMDFLHPLPVGALWGVGPKTEEILLRLGLRTVGDLAHVPARPCSAPWARPRARTCTSCPGGATRAGWSRGAGEVHRSRGDLRHRRRRSGRDPRELLLLAERTAGPALGATWLARTVSIKVRFADFATITRSRTLDVPTDVGQELYDTARALYDALGLDRARIRLVGVRAERLVDARSAPQQLELGAGEHGRREAELAADRAARRFGAGAVRPATLLHRDGRPGRADRAAKSGDPAPTGRPPPRGHLGGVTEHDPDGAPHGRLSRVAKGSYPRCHRRRKPPAATGSAHLEE